MEQTFSKSEVVELPNCIKLNKTVYLVGDVSTLDNTVEVFELFDMTREMSNGESYSIYMSNPELFKQATVNERTLVRIFLNLLGNN